MYSRFVSQTGKKQATSSLSTVAKTQMRNNAAAYQGAFQMRSYITAAASSSSSLQKNNFNKARELMSQGQNQRDGVKNYLLKHQIRQLHYARNTNVYRPNSSLIAHSNYSMSEFHSSSNKDDETKKSESKSEYEKRFGDLLDNQNASKMTDQEKQIIEEQKRAKVEKDQQSAEQIEKEKERLAKEKQQQFEDLAAGRVPTKSADEKNLQDLFRDFYSKVQAQDPNEYVNSAKTSLNAFSSKLEERRQKFKKQKEEEQQKKDEENAKESGKDQTIFATKKQEVDQETTQKTQDVAQEAAKKSTDKSTEAKEKKEEESASAAEGATDATEDATQDKEKIKEKLSFKARIQSSYNQKLENLDSSLKSKAPGAHEKTTKFVSMFKDVWAETFPTKQNITSKLDKRKERARLIKMMEENKLTPEEEEELMESIPEWKRGALVISEEQEEEEKPGFFKRMKQNARSKINETEAAKNFYESEEYKQIDQARKEVREFKNQLKDQVDHSQNPTVQAASQVTDKLFNESQCGRAVRHMQKYDPEFDLEDLSIETEEVFKEFYCNYLSGNLKYIEQVCQGTALALSKTTIQLREKQGWEPKYKDLLDLGDATFQGGNIENKVPTFIYHITVQEIDCRVSMKPKKDSEGNVIEGEYVEEIVEGNEYNIMANTYRVALSLHDEPDLELMGHYWSISEFYKIGEVRQLV